MARSGSVQPDSAPRDRLDSDPPLVPALVHHDPYDASWRERLVVFGAMGAALACGLVFGLIYSRSATFELLGLVPASQFAVGKFLPLWGISGKSNFTPFQLGLVIWVMDTCNVLILVYALEGFYKLRRFKSTLDKIQSNASLVLAAYPSVHRAALVGVVLFVLFPVAGTGAWGATFLGILLGMKRGVLIAAVSFGGLLGGMLMAFAATYFYSTVLQMQQLQQNPSVKYAIIGGVLALLGVGLYFLNRAYKRALEQARLGRVAAPPGHTAPAPAAD